MKISVKTSTVNIEYRSESNYAVFVGANGSGKSDLIFIETEVNIQKANRLEN